MINRIGNSREYFAKNGRFCLQPVIGVVTGTGLITVCRILLLTLILVVSGCSEEEDSSGGTSGGTGGGETNSMSAFESTLYPVLVNRCGECHASEGPGGTPDFSHESVATAFGVIEANTLVNLSNVDNSRLIQKLLNELHRCGTSCDAWANEIRVAIQNWAAVVAEPGGNTGTSGSAITSSTLTLADSDQRAGGGRIEDSVIAKYEFKTGSGRTAFDTSGIAPALNLTLSNDVNWVAGQGIEITDPNATEVSNAVGSSIASAKLYNLIAAPGGSQQYTIEAWIINASTALSGPARIVSYSADSQNRNFTMGQQNDYYNFRNRSNLTGNNGSNPTLESDNNAGDLKTELQHVVFTYNSTNGRNIFVNGMKLTYEGVASDPAVPSDISNWDDSYQFILGNEVPDNVRRQWLGKIMFVAIHNRALSETEISQNTRVGIGQTYVLQFNVSEPLDPSGFSTSIIKLEVKELDAYSYVFGLPTITSSIPSPSFPIKNIRISVNDSIPAAAQAFSTIDTTVTSSPTELSRLGAVIPKDLGSDMDRFKLVFEVLGSNSDLIVEQDPVTTIDQSVNPASPESGLRTFEQINNTMATVTGVDKAVTSNTFNNLRQQLPSTHDLGTFVSANQVGIAKLSLEYCDALIRTESLRTAFFGNSFEFNSAVSTAFSNQTKRNIIIANLVNKMVGTNLNSQPSLAEIQPDLDQLISELTAGCNVAADCDATRTRAVVTGACAAVLGSAAVLIN